MEGTDGGEIDQLAGSAISDIEQYWETAYPDAFDDEFTPAKALVSWDAGGFDGEFCGDDTYGLVNAGYCFAGQDDRLGPRRAAAQLASAHTGTWVW